MGLLIANYELDSGLIIDNAYVRIDTLSGSKLSMSLDVKFYKNRDAFINGLSYANKKQYSFTPDVREDALNYHKQGYEYLKALEEYVNAVDVLEEG